MNYNYTAAAGQSGAGSTSGNAGQLMTVYNSTINGQTESASYTYDLLGRLATSSQTSNGSSANRRYEYDRWGNRTAVLNATIGGTQIQSVSLQMSGGAPTNRITSVTNSGSTVNYLYDAAGNVINDGQHTYQYDAENRVATVDGGATAQYGYDHQNRRVKKVSGGFTTYYVWEGNQVIAEPVFTASGQYIHTIEYVYSGGRMLMTEYSGIRHYYLNDRLSVRLITDNSGSVAGQQGHLPFGEEFGLSGAQNKHRFTNYERDAESGTDYAVNRQYCASVGRFNRPDPLASSSQKETPQTWNKYAYSTNDTTNKKDPTGLIVWNVPPPGFWDENPCRPFGMSYILDGFDTYASLFCGMPFRSPFNSFQDLLDTLLAAFQVGKLSVDSGCQRAVYVPEGGKPRWNDAVGASKVDCDAVATPKGVVKIPNGCSCDVNCSGGNDYRIDCICLGARPPWDPFTGKYEPPRALRAGSGFPNPRDHGHSWVPILPLYTRTRGALPPESGVWTPLSDFYIFN